MNTSRALELLEQSILQEQNMRRDCDSGRLHQYDAFDPERSKEREAAKRLAVEWGKAWEAVDGMDELRWIFTHGFCFVTSEEGVKLVKVYDISLRPHLAALAAAAELKEKGTP